MKLSRQFSILFLGSFITLLAAGGWYAGFASRLELWFLDWKLKNAPSREISDDIVHVDIDDSSLEEIGRWPWPRQQLAGIIETLKSCGAQTVALDIEFPEPQKIRYVSQAQSVYGGYKKVLHQAPPQAVMDDAILASAIADAENVILAMHMDFENASPLAYEDRIAQTVLENPGMPFRQLCMEITGADPQDAASNEAEDRFNKAYLRVTGRLALQKFSLGNLNAARGQTVPPLCTLLNNAQSAGFVTVKPDDDGIVRRIRLIGNDNGSTYAQFAFAMALIKLQQQYDNSLEVKTDRNSILISADGKDVLSIPLEDDGILINWSLGRPGRIDQRHEHIPAKAALKVWQEKQRLAQAEVLRFALKVKWLSLVKKIDDSDLDDLFWDFKDNTEKCDALYARRTELQRQQYFNSLYEPSMPPLQKQVNEILLEEQRLEKLRFQQADELYEKCLTNRDKVFDRPCDILPLDASDELVHAYEDYLTRIRQADELQQILAALPEDRANLEQNIVKLQHGLSDKVSGKICLIGSTATGAADFVPTALKGRTPGVMVHAGIYDTIISGKFITTPPAWFNLMVIISAGLVMTLLALRFNAPICGPVGIILGLLWAWYNAYIVIPGLGMNITTAGPMLSMLGVFVVLTGYKEITEERAKRKIRGMFSKALSSSLVDELMRDPKLADLGGRQRELSCMFSDIAGFTPMSQRLGARQTVQLLNRYFDCVTDVVQTRYSGYINKFLGDGVFALFGAPVVQGNHAELAVKAAVEYQRAVSQLNAEMPDEGLRVRIGITTGRAMVGNCGSTTRMDYTAIGDCVNLSSRLEAANKFFNTGILIDQQTWKQAHLEEVMLARPLGLARITGVAEPVWIMNVAGYLEHNRALAEPFEIFSRGMKLLYEKDYVRAVEIFEQISKDMDDDVACGLFFQIAREGLAGESYQSAVVAPSQYSGGVVRIVAPWEIE